MDQPAGCRRPWEHVQRVGRWGLMGLLVVLGLTLSAHECVVAAQQPDGGGTIIWAVHEGMPNFDIHTSGIRGCAEKAGLLPWRSCSHSVRQKSIGVFAGRDDAADN